ncbi:MAG TPA: methyltransferase domain-containing protein [Baekduia sp.]|nr:methyltransferase domain-containing protein [Baekduia sp.]
MDVIEEIVVVAGRDLALRRPRDPEELLDEEAFDADEYLPYWAELWPSGVALAQSVGTRALRGARVVELGCGLGLPSIAAALAGGRVLATDWSHDALALLRENAAANGAKLETMHVDWREPQPLAAQAPFDLVLAADVLYERANAERLADLLPRLGAEVLLADPGRATLDAFLERVGTVWRRPPLYRLR